MIQTKFQNLLTCILYTYDKINIHTSWRLFNLFRRLRSWRCEGGAIGVIWRWTTYRSLRGRANAISFFIYFDYFFFHLIVFFFYLLHVDFGFTCIYQHYCISCPFQRDGVPVFCYSILAGRCFYLWEGVT